jgi:AraC-like DNA-binding protein
MTLTAPAPITGIRDVDLASAARRLDRLRLMQLVGGTWRFASAEGVGRTHLVIYSVDGSTLLVDDRRTFELGAGEFLVLRGAPARQLVAEVERGFLALVIPDEAAGVYLTALAGAAGSVIATRTGTPSLIAHLLDGLAAQPAASVAELPLRLAQHLIGMIALMCAEVGRADADGHAPLLQNAKEFIERHLGEMDLSPDRIAAAHNVSTRTLHRMFEGAGLTISGWIRGRRLEHCRVDLADPLQADVSVGTIGARWGLWDAAHFSRLFKVSFGMSPRAYREVSRRNADRRPTGASGASA